MSMAHLRRSSEAVEGLNAYNFNWERRRSTKFLRKKTGDRAKDSSQHSQCFNIRLIRRNRTLILLLKNLELPKGQCDLLAEAWILWFFCFWSRFKNDSKLSMRMHSDYQWNEADQNFIGDDKKVVSKLDKFARYSLFQGSRKDSQLQEVSYQKTIGQYSTGSYSTLSVKFSFNRSYGQVFSLFFWVQLKLLVPTLSGCICQVWWLFLSLGYRFGFTGRNLIWTLN